MVGMCFFSLSLSISLLSQFANCSVRCWLFLPPQIKLVQIKLLKITIKNPTTISTFNGCHGRF